MSVGFKAQRVNTAHLKHAQGHDRGRAGEWHAEQESPQEVAGFRYTPWTKGWQGAHTPCVNKGGRAGTQQALWDLQGGRFHTASALCRAASRACT